MGDNPCLHLEGFINDDGLQVFNLLHGVFVISGSEERRQAKIINAKCYICDKNTFLHVCMHCTFFGCRKHIREHTKNKKHVFSMDILHGQVHCSECNDYVYDEKLDNVATVNALNGDSVKKHVIELVLPRPSLHLDDQDWCKKTEKLIIHETTRIGLRGLLNLGSTCFMNCVVQAMTHTPVLRDYFLTEQHRCVNKPKKCLITNLFREFYTGEKTPLVLNEFLHLIWTQAKHLSGYEQQDAHEFFLAALDVLHRHCSEASNSQLPSSVGEVQGCSCIIDQVFIGSLQSDVVCQKCNGVSTTIDPMWDYSLDLTSSAANGSLPASLENCLEHFTDAEILGSNIGFGTFYRRQ